MYMMSQMRRESTKKVVHKKKPGGRKRCTQSSFYARQAKIHFSPGENIKIFIIFCDNLFLSVMCMNYMKGVGSTGYLTSMVFLYISVGS